MDYEINIYIMSKRTMTFGYPPEFLKKDVEHNMEFQR